MKKSLVLAMAMALGVTASAYAANPFSDVPAGHWAYDSISKLAAAGVIEGYPDGTFGGDKLMTRYEMAQIVAKAMAKGANVDRLAAEFADELDNLGVRVAALEKKADNVKITGQVRYNYADQSGDFDGHASKLRSRLWIKGQVNDDWSYTGMLQNIQDFADNDGEEKTEFQRAYVSGKLGGLQVEAGRNNLTIAQGNLYDHRADGVKAAYGKDVKLTVGHYKLTPKDAKEVYDARLTFGEVGAKLGAVDFGAGYYNFDGKNTAEDNNVWQANLGFGLGEDFKLGAMYLRSDADVDDKDGFVVSADFKGAKASKPGSWGLFAKYYDQANVTYLEHTMNGNYTELDNGFKGYMVGANYAVAKNIVGQVEYYDLKDKENDEKAKTLWSQVVFTF
ncbi:MAG: S-layer homology domain-containing protein [Acidaminococcaceae bacterium]|nr:S-layer homology domain-containing protein [Acidaminococcaceae bacterium]